MYGPKADRHMASTPESSPECVCKWMRPHFTLKTLLSVCFVVAVLLGMWRVLFVSEASVYGITKGEEAIARFFTVGNLGEGGKGKAVFGVAGRLPGERWIRATLYSVQKGTIKQVASISAGVHSYGISNRFDIRFALCKNDKSLTPELMLGVSGHRKAGGSGTPLFECRRPTNKKVFTGFVSLGSPTIAYVEGDESTVDRRMTVQEFAERNSTGDYIVITVE